MWTSRRRGTAAPTAHADREDAAASWPRSARRQGPGEARRRSSARRSGCPGRRDQAKSPMPTKLEADQRAEGTPSSRAARRRWSLAATSATDGRRRARTPASPMRQQARGAGSIIASTARSASPESSPLAMKPRAPLRSTSGPKSRAVAAGARARSPGPAVARRSAAGDLEAVDVGQVDVEQHDVGLAARAAALERGSRRPAPRRRPRSPRSRAAARAVARKLGWSSTIRTVVAMCRQ